MASTNIFFIGSALALRVKYGQAQTAMWTGQFFAKYGFDIVQPPVITNTPMKTYKASFVKVQK
jgi:hypothetical protein